MRIATEIFLKIFMTPMFFDPIVFDMRRFHKVLSAILTLERMQT